jgi:hypothetical protein
MGVFDSYVTVGEETVAYGTVASSLTRGYTAMADPIAIVMQNMRRLGLRASSDTWRHEDVLTHTLGGEGSFDVAVENKGMGLLFKAMLSTSTAITGPPAGFSFSSTANAPSTSLSVQIARGFVDSSSVSPETGLGGRVKSWEWTQSVASEDAFAMLKLAMDYRDVDTAVAAATATYPSDPWIYSWRDCTVTVDGNDVCSWDLSITGDHKIKTDRYCLSGQGLKDAPYRTDIAAYGGGFTTDYTDDTIRDLYHSGDPVPIVVTYAHPTATDEIVITMPACKFTGGQPVSTPGSSQVTAVFEAFRDASTPAIDINYITTDVAP